MDELMKRLLMGTQEPGFEIRIESADAIETLQAQLAEWRSRAEFAEAQLAGLLDMLPPPEPGLLKKRMMERKAVRNAAEPDIGGGGMSEARRSALEEAARVAKSAWLTSDTGTIGDAEYGEALCHEIADAIRALAEKE